MAQVIWSWMVSVAGYLALALLGGSLLVGFAYWLFKLLTERWLEAKFAERLERFKHEQNKELEQLRYKINALLDRAVKLHQREFETLPECWRLAVRAYNTALALTSSLQSFADVQRMTPEHLEEFLGESSLKQWQKSELKAAADKNGYYQNVVIRDNIGRAREACRDFHQYLSANGVFMVPTIKTRFDELDRVIWEAVIEFQTNEEMKPTPRMRDAVLTLNKEGKELKDSIEIRVQERLWGDQLNSPAPSA